MNTSAFSIFLKQGMSICRRGLKIGFLFVFSLERVIRVIEEAFNEARLKRLRNALRSCGDNLSVQFPVMVTHPEMVDIGNEVSFAAYIHIWGGGTVIIGNRVMVGTHTSITSLTHDYTQKDMHVTLIRKTVIIEDDVWIGSNCVILPGVTIGRGAVIGAGSVVTRDIQPGTVAFGVPAMPRNDR